MTTASALFDAARQRLADAPKQGLGVAKVSRWRALRIVRAGEAWHLGVLLLGDDGVYTTGEVLRAAEEVRRGYAAESARARADRRAQARRGGFGEGEIVHVGWTALDVAAVDAGGASGPLLVADGVPSVRWSAAGVMPLEVYLNEQIELRYPGSGD
ncbi:glutaminase [Microbacterium bovistercoris]|uniref:Glutaminase n=1 Tax=Microbacterium bovistercoris TaxID=2293570 RepID=A0A371NYJ0_9MICO|nr:glutaminase [Microbacterium bovistercoris]REJ07844.1 glutaminase [Microbacterium bovistercoris]